MQLFSEQIEFFKSFENNAHQIIHTRYSSNYRNKKLQCHD